MPSARQPEKYLVGYFTIDGVLLQVKCKSKYRNGEGNYTDFLMQPIGGNV